MKNFRIFLALIAFIGSASAFAQFDDGEGDAVGAICEEGRYCPPPIPPAPGPGHGRPGHGGGGSPIDPSPYDPQPIYPENPGYPGSGHQTEVYVGRVFANQDLDLMRMMNLWNFRGQNILAVEVSVRPEMGRSELHLIADGYLEDTQSAFMPNVTLSPRRDLVLGQNVRNLHLGIRDRLFVERISVIFGSGYSPYPGPGPGIDREVVVPVHVGQSFAGAGFIDVLNRSNLRSYYGYRISSVTVFGQSQGFSASARLIANGRLMGGMTFSNFLTGLTVYPNEQYLIGQNLQSMNLQVDGRARIERIEVRLVRY